VPKSKDDLGLDAPFVKELVSLGFDAFDDPEEISKVTADAVKTIVEDQKSNREDNNSRSLLAIVAVLVHMDKRQRQRDRVLKLLLFTVIGGAALLFALDKAGLIKFTIH
jgi:hypothetical protein